MKTTVIVTSISGPNAALRAIADGSKMHDFEFIVCGDTKSPENFDLSGCRFMSIQDQVATGLRFAAACPVKTYARKNVGYLTAINEGTDWIIETDDDNFPLPAFFLARSLCLTVPSIAGAGWLNVYRYFTNANIWPRGLPLDAIQRPPPPFEKLRTQEVNCPIQQGLADENPDVDAIYRLVLTLPQNFRTDRRIALGTGAWSPFNSQNTTWWRGAFPLLYLPVHCSFRMTDIWRSFVAQRIGWENGWHILFHEPTVRQERNEHDLMRDFTDEVPGYLHNERIRRALEDTSLIGGIGNLSRDLRHCYEVLIALDVVGAQELVLVDAWRADLDRIAEGRSA